MDVRLGVAGDGPVPQIPVVDVVGGRLPHDRPERHAAVDERRRLVARGQRARMPEPVGDQRHEGQGEDAPRREQPAPPSEDEQPDGEERREQPSGGVAVHHRPEREADRRAAREPVRPVRPLGREEHAGHAERKQRGVISDAAELEEPRRQAREHECRDGDPRAPRPPPREQAHEHDRGEDGHGGEASRHLLVRARHAEDRREQVDEERALVVLEGDEVERQQAAVLVAQAVADRVGVVRERRLVADETRRVRRGDPELEAEHEQDAGCAEEQGGSPQQAADHGLD